MYGNCNMHYAGGQKKKAYRRRQQRSHTITTNDKRQTPKHGGISENNYAQ